MSEHRASRSPRSLGSSLPAEIGCELNGDKVNRVPLGTFLTEAPKGGCFRSG